MKSRLSQSGAPRWRIIIDFFEPCSPVLARLKCFGVSSALNPETSPVDPVDSHAAPFYTNFDDMPLELQVLAMARVLSQIDVSHQRCSLKTMQSQLELRAKLRRRSLRRRLHIDHMNALATILAVKDIPVATMNNIISAAGLKQSRAALSAGGLSSMRTTPRTQSAALLFGTEAAHLTTRLEFQQHVHLVSGMIRFSFAQQTDLSLLESYTICSHYSATREILRSSCDAVSMRQALKDLMTDNAACPQLRYEDRIYVKDLLWYQRLHHPLSPELEAIIWRTKEPWSVSAYARLLKHLLDGISDAITMISLCLGLNKNPCVREAAAERLVAFSRCVFKLARTESVRLQEIWKRWQRSWRGCSGSKTASDDRDQQEDFGGVPTLSVLKWLRRVCKPVHAVSMINTAKDDPYLAHYLESPASPGFRTVLRTWDDCQTVASFDPVIVFRHLSKVFPDAVDWARAFHALFPSQPGVERRVTVRGFHLPELLVLDSKIFSSPVGLSRKSCPTTSWILSRWPSCTEKFVATSAGHSSFNPNVLLPPELDRHCPGIRISFLRYLSTGVQRACALLVQHRRRIVMPRFTLAIAKHDAERKIRRAAPFSSRKWRPRARVFQSREALSMQSLLPPIQEEEEDCLDMIEHGEKRTEERMFYECLPCSHTTH